MYRIPGTIRCFEEQRCDEWQLSECSNQPGISKKCDGRHSLGMLEEPGIPCLEQKYVLTGYKWPLLQQDFNVFLIPGQWRVNESINQANENAT